MIQNEGNARPTELDFDVAIVSIGYERRCRWIVEETGLRARHGLGLEFGFLAEGSYCENRKFFEARSYEVHLGLDPSAVEVIHKAIAASKSNARASIFVDISAMSREMIANVILGIERASKELKVDVCVGYSPSKFGGSYAPAPIRRAAPIKMELRGWSSRPDLPLGTIMGLGCEPGMALGALQYLEPQKSWAFWPQGVDEDFNEALAEANDHISDIFDVTDYQYDISNPGRTRGRFEALLNSLSNRYRIIIVPFGPKIFAWLSISTVVFRGNGDVGIWAFSSKEQGNPVDRQASGPILWYTFALDRTSADVPA